jgi:glutathione S-transferase
MVTIEPIPAGLRKGDEAALEKAKTQFAPIAAFVSRSLEGKKWILGDEFTAADIALGGIISYSKMFGLLEGWPRLQEYAAALAERPARKRANAD